MRHTPEIPKTDAIRQVIEPISHSHHYMELSRRRAEKEMGWLVASAGILVGEIRSHYDDIYRRDDSFVTTEKLVGHTRRLNRGTLIRAQSLSLPVDTSNEGIDTFLSERWRYPELQREIGLVALNEPGFPIFNPIKTSVSGYIETSTSGVDLAAIGVEKYLAGDSIHALDESPEEIEKIIQATYKRVPIYEKRLSDALRKLMN